MENVGYFARAAGYSLLAIPAMFLTGLAVDSPSTRGAAVLVTYAVLAAVISWGCLRSLPDPPPRRLPLFALGFVVAAVLFGATSGVAVAAGLPVLLALVLGVVLDGLAVGAVLLVARNEGSRQTNSRA